MASRFYLPADQWSVDQLTGDEARHAMKVLRIRLGEEIELFDGAGRVKVAQVTSLASKCVEFSVLSESQVTAVAPRIHLYQAIPKGKNMDLIIQKAVELGVEEITPLVTQNTVAVSDAPEKKVEKWQRVALEAAKQCKQAWMPKVNLPLPMNKLGTPTEELALVASLRENAQSMRAVVEAHQEVSSVSLLVGPEGDFTDDELSQAEQLGFLPITMGDLVLRVETATLYGISALRYAL